MSHQHNTSWDAEVVKGLISQERMNTYLKATNEDLDEAFKLYVKNMEIASSIQMMTGIVEVIVRNSIDKNLSAWNNSKRPGTDWFDMNIFNSQTRQDIEKAKTRIRNKNNRTHEKIIPELTFGFSKFLVSKHHHTSLWVPSLHKAFPLGNEDISLRRIEVHSILDDLSFIRNRAAHLEPLFKRDIESDFLKAEKILSWISPEAVLWFKDISPKIKQYAMHISPEIRFRVQKPINQLPETSNIHLPYQNNTLGKIKDF